MPSTTPATPRCTARSDVAIAVVKFLAERGATLTLKNKAGFTPLDLAMGQGGRGGRGGVVRESTAALLKQLISQAPPKPSKSAP